MLIGLQPNVDPVFLTESGVKNRSYAVGKHGWENSGTRKTR
jgi:hypothetical protein